MHAGKISLCWAGTTPRLNITDPEIIKEVLANKQGHIGITPFALDPLVLTLTEGLTLLEGEIWATHRKIMTPAFKLEKLKVIFKPLSPDIIFKMVLRSLGCMI